MPHENSKVLVLGVSPQGIAIFLSGLIVYEGHRKCISEGIQTLFFIKRSSIVMVSPQYDGARAVQS